MTSPQYPPWVVLHIPHDSTFIPAQPRSQFLLTDSALALELQRMTDHFTHSLFAEPPGEAVVVRAPVSRLVVDVERFADDIVELMAARGMGVIYEVTSDLLPLRRQLLPEERDLLIRQWYRPHHLRLESAVDKAIEQYGRCLVVDCHSFPGTPLPYEKAELAAERPDICIGVDEFHTPKALERAFVETFGQSGWRVSVNTPFAGALVPITRYRRDSKVSAVMVEVNRDLYLEPFSIRKSSKFEQIASTIKGYCSKAICSVTK